MLFSAWGKKEKRECPPSPFLPTLNFMSSAGNKARRKHNSLVWKERSKILFTNDIIVSMSIISMMEFGKNKY